MDQLTEYIDLAKDLWPFMLWASGIQHITKQNRKDIDILFYELRGKEGMRDSSMVGLVKRALYNIKKGKKNDTNRERSTD